ncbi:MAG: hypothetical protein KDA45_04055 [Planctomycetales bacterium]|nr:hypothetical protein [Planctomycetales bacterium]
MTQRSILFWAVMVALGSLLSTRSVAGDEPQQQAAGEQTLAALPDPSGPLSLDDARARATVMHNVYAATLEVLHHRYFHRDRSIIPARAMQDIFAEIERQSKTEARWIAASMKAMSVDHAPQGDFEVLAAREIAAGKPYVEAIEEGYYRRAGAIPLGVGCVGCHGGAFKSANKTPQFAGLVISVPLSAEQQAPAAQ